MGHASCSLAISNRIKALDKKAFARIHIAAVVPCLIWMILEIEQFESIALGESRIALIRALWWEEDRDGNEVLISRSSSVAEG